VGVKEFLSSALNVADRLRIPVGSSMRKEPLLLNGRGRSGGIPIRSGACVEEEIPYSYWESNSDSSAVQSVF